MKKFFSRYSHWVTLIIITFSFFPMFYECQMDTQAIIAAIMGGIGLISFGALTIVFERKKRNKEN